MRKLEEGGMKKIVVRIEVRNAPFGEGFSGQILGHSNVIVNGLTL
jgi:hypothetical protein